MAGGLKEKEYITETFGKVVDPRVRDHLLAGHINLGGQVQEVTILFCDIRGFTPMSEKLAPSQVVELLNLYLERMSRCITAEHGLVNKYIGDAIMAIFGAPLSQADHADAAFRAALKMRTAWAELNADLVAAGLPSIRIGIGIHTGPVVAGNIGSTSRMEYTVIGDTVNVASRIEGLCKELHHDLIITESTAMKLSGQHALPAAQSVQIRGKEEPMRVYRV
jgi:adenylate cyclase